MKSTNLKLLKFWAEWCGPCKMQSELFVKEPLSIDLQEINVDEDENEFCSKFGIRNIPTMILVDEDNFAIKRWTGITQPSVIEEEISKIKEANETDSTGLEDSSTEE